MIKKKLKKKLKQEDVVEKKYKQHCLSCEETRQLNFYTSYNEQYSFFKYIPWCKDCIEKIYQKNFNTYGSIKIALIHTCRDINIPFYASICDGAIQESAKRGWTIRKAYMKIFISTREHNRYSSEFKGGECSNIIENPIAEMLIKESDTSLDKDGETIIYITRDTLLPQDEGVKNDVIKLLRYDPFYGYSISDQRFLYNELITYLDEDILEDSFKLSQVIQIVNNNNQIRSIDLGIAQYTSGLQDLMQNETKISALSKSKASIVMNTDKIAKENGISVKNRGDKTAGKSTLSSLMKQYRELGFDDAEQDYYDQNKAYGMKLVADISNKSILDQLQFDENDVHDMFFMQRQLVQELQEKILDVEEKNRLLHVELDKVKLVDM